MMSERETPATSADAGFTLVEALTAMTVLAISAAVLMGVAETHIGRIAGLEERAAARWGAETVLSEIRSGARAPEDAQVDLEMSGSVVSVRIRVSPTEDRDILSVRLDAQAQTARSPGAVVEGFVLVRDTRE
jgi:type II secretion system protein I